MNLAHDFKSTVLRKYAMTLLNMADAIDEGKVRLIPSGKHDFIHTFYGHPLDNQVVSTEEPIPSEGMTKVTQCTHELKAHAFYLVFASCRITGEFFLALKTAKWCVT